MKITRQNSLNNACANVSNSDYYDELISEPLLPQIKNAFYFVMLCIAYSVTLMFLPLMLFSDWVGEK